MNIAAERVASLFDLTVTNERVTTKAGTASWPTSVFEQLVEEYIQEGLETGETPEYAIAQLELPGEHREIFTDMLRENS